MTPYPVAPGSVIRARPVGVLHMTDEAGGDAKLIAVPHDKLSVLYKDVKEYTDLPALLLEQIKHFFEMILEARAADIVHTPAVSGVPASFMRQSLEAAGYDLKRLTDKADMNYGEKLKPVNDEAKAWKTVWSAGQGAGNIDDLPGVDELVARLDREYRDALRNMDSLANRWPR